MEAQIAMLAFSASHSQRRLCIICTCTTEASELSSELVLRGTQSDSKKIYAPRAPLHRSKLESWENDSFGPKHVFLRVPVGSIRGGFWGVLKCHFDNFRLGPLQMPLG